MPKFRKRPVVIEAEQFHPAQRPWPLGVVRIGRVPSDPTSQTGFRIQTLEGWHVVTPGDWIITGVKGERYPCRPDIFAETYDQFHEQNPAPPAGGDA